MMTECLYYDQSYLTAFEAHVLSCERRDRFFHVALDRTAFYPTSGGQPNDVGSLGGAQVSDVYVDEAHVVYHVVDRALQVGEAVAGEIDWARRFDHMQQHAGDHMIAGVIWQLYQGYTVGLHLGEAFSTIDIIMPDGSTHMSGQMVAEIERLVNQDIQADQVIQCFFPSEVELARLPLRKPPAVKENIRVVLIGERECVACGGTHPSSTGQIGLVKILWTAPSRGKLRLAFASGMRAMRDYQGRYAASEALCALLSLKPDQIPEAVEALIAKSKALEAELAHMKRDAALSMCGQLLTEAHVLEGGWRLIARELEGMDMNTLKELAKRLTQQQRVYALLAHRQPDGVSLLFARSQGDGADMGALLKKAAIKYSGKGGGRPDFAQGAVSCGEALEYAIEELAAMHDRGL